MVCIVQELFIYHEWEAGKVQHKPSVFSTFLVTPIVVFIVLFGIKVIFGSSLLVKLIFVFLGLFFSGLWILTVKTIRYFLCDDHLSIKFLCFKKKIFYPQIERLEKRDSYSCSIEAPGYHQILLFNRFDEVIAKVSPENPDVFLNDLNRLIKK